MSQMYELSTLMQKLALAFEMLLEGKQSISICLAHCPMNYKNKFSDKDIHSVQLSIQFRPSELYSETKCLLSFSFASRLIV